MMTELEIDIVTRQVEEVLQDTDNPFFIGLFYNEDTKRFIDEDGYVVWNIFELITPNDLLLFRESQDYFVTRHRALKGVFIELYWPEYD